MSNAYESTFIVDAHLSNELIESSIKKFSKIITDSGGTIKMIDRWGKRRLAYEIAKKQYGYYVYIRFDADGTLIKSLEREYKLDDSVIRYLTVSVPKAVVGQEGEFASKHQESESDSDSNFTKEQSEIEMDDSIGAVQEDESKDDFIEETSEKDKVSEGDETSEKDETSKEDETSEKDETSKKDETSDEQETSEKDEKEANQEG